MNALQIGYFTVFTKLNIYRFYYVYLLKAAITTIESVFVEDQVIGEAIAKFNRTNTNVFISGDLSVEDFDTSILPRDPYQFKFIDASPSNIKLEAAPLKVVMKFLGDEFASGSLQIRSIVSSQ